MTDASPCLAVIARRACCRRFLGTPVPGEVLDTLLEAALRAPSAGNLQPWRILAVRSVLGRRALARAALGQAHVEEAPVVFAICAVPERSARRYGDRGRSLYVLQDTAALAATLLLAAEALDLGAAWVGAFDEDQVARVLALPPGERPVALLPVGLRAEAPRGRTPRRPVAEVVTWVDDPPAD